MIALEDYDFTWIRQYNKNWQSQSEIPPESKKAALACLYHYGMDVSLLIRYLGNNYTGEHRNVEETAAVLLQHGLDSDLVEHYRRVMTVGCPRVFNTEVTRENAMKYWRAGNNPSIGKKLPQVMKTMNKEHKNNHVIALPGWTWRFIPHLFTTPQHNHVRAGHKDRLIGDASFMHDPDSIPVNSMTEDASKTELRCDFGTVKQRLYKRLYNLRITHPDRDLVIHANDVKSCFRQLKHHPDVVSVFSFIISETLFLSCGLFFGADFSPASWEAPRRVIEKLAEALFSDKSLRQKHRAYLDQLKWQRGLGSQKAKFTVAVRDSINRGVADADGEDASTPHDAFVDDILYADVFCIERMEQAAAACIEAIFIVLGRSDLSK